VYVRTFRCVCVEPQSTIFWLKWIIIIIIIIIIINCNWVVALWQLSLH